MKDADKSILETVLKHISEQNEKMFKAIADVEKKHFEELQETSTKQFEVFMKHLDYLDSPKPLYPQSDPFTESINKEANPIEEKQEEDIPLGEMPRIPIVQGVNVRFEDDEESYPINIESPSGV